VADEEINRIGVMLEELGARFELVLEAVSGFGGRLDALREEMSGQFAEVGGQIRFLSEQIAENRRTIIVTREDLGAEIIRVAEAVGQARVEFREDLGNTAKVLRGEFREDLGNTAKVLRTEFREDLGAATKELRDEFREGLDLSSKELRAEFRQDLSKSTKDMRAEFNLGLGSHAKQIADLQEELRQSTAAIRAEMKDSAKRSSAEAESIAKRFQAELKQTNKSLASLSAKFDRFDDRITVRTRDQDQRLKKLEKKRAS
jgi:ElaB/YqjD/DUF883 family membrane-anchored ribosome-binding protein